MKVSLTHQAGEPQVYVIHENDAWVEPLRNAFAEQGIPFAEWHLDEGVLDLDAAPPQGVFYNRMSASSHTRGHRYGPELTAATLAWLTHHGRTIVNGERAVQLEVSKVAQYQSLASFGVETPRTLAAVGRKHIAEAAERIGYPLILKHNRAGKGLGVHLFLSREGLADYLASDGFEESVDGITLIQRYIEAPEPFITRVEFIGGKFLYAVRVDTSEGFELCPADVCNIDAGQIAQMGSVCPAVAPSEKFRIIEGFDHPLLPKWQALLAANDIQVAGIEIIVDKQGRPYTYDVNTNTNYNADAEARANEPGGMKAIAAYLGALLAEEKKKGAIRSAA
jgi:hypothetical protein